jgi:hypothetical protein
MFCVPVLVFGDTDSVGSRFHVLRSRTHFRRFRWRRVPFSCFALPDTFSAVPKALDPVFMFCASRLVFDDIVGVRSRFHVLHSRTLFRQCGGCWVPFSCFVLPNSFSVVLRASSPVFMFCVPRTHFRRYRRRRAQYSCLELPNTFSTVRRASGPIFMFCTLRLVFSVSEGVGSRFHVLHPRTHFRW